MKLTYQQITNVVIACALCGLLFSRFLSSDCKQNDYRIRYQTIKTVEKDNQHFKVVPDVCVGTNKIKESFDKIYRSGEWETTTQSPEDFYGDASWPTKEKRQISASGKGSFLGSATETSLRIIKETITKYDITSMVDVPCGDANWIFDSFITDTLPLYVGLDIVEDVIAVNKMRFSHHKNKQFYFWDAVNCDFPKFQHGTNDTLKSFDLVHIRDVIQHLPQRDGIKYFCNAFLSGVKYMITTTYPGEKNKNIEPGGWYENNLEMEPFSFPKSDSCSFSHEKGETGVRVEDDLTCVYDLSKPWVKTFIETKC